MKKLSLLVFTLFVTMLSSGIVFAQDGPPVLIDPFATDAPADDGDATDDGPPTLELATPPAADEPVVDAPAADDDPIALPATDDPVADDPIADDPGDTGPPTLELAPSDSDSEATPAAPSHSAATSVPAPQRTADSGPGLAILLVGSLLGAGALKRRKK